MRLLNFLIFFSIVISINSALNYYIIRRGLDVIPQGSPNRVYFVWLIIFLASAFLVGRILENFTLNFFTSTLIWIGAFWIAFMVYFFLSFLVIDFFRLLNHFFGIFPSFITNNIEKSKEITAYVVVGITFFTVLFGHINTWFPVIRNYEFSINKSAGNLKELKIVTVSDIHLGTTIGPKYLAKVVDKINALEPDIILIPGDIIDEDIRPVLRNNSGEYLKKLKSNYGTFAVTGNHEYIGGVDAAKKYLNEHGVLLLNDEAQLIDSSFYLVGREDKDISRFTENERKELHEITDGLDKSFPLILLDHQPFALEKAVQNGIDLQLSGHTHHGQLWPFNYITEMVYEISWGYKKKEDSHIYVSSGVGGWGPPIRTNSRPEIIEINLKFIGK
ncbi:MAG: metallophosphoesterase [Melioribacteraceae bacterium]|nr:metallophosphoesterase [Melioribacteraceae bacterium]MCF8263468.1 metallophosphoesterase [Melioribacteraceae bacterium]MCF8431264.1 metallophosphoesterase [Melioribacteraceae bacterium]